MRKRYGNDADAETDGGADADRGAENISLIEFVPTPCGSHADAGADVEAMRSSCGRIFLHHIDIDQSVFPDVQNAHGRVSSGVKLAYCVSRFYHYLLLHVRD